MSIAVFFLAYPVVSSNEQGGGSEDSRTTYIVQQNRAKGVKRNHDSIRTREDYNLRSRSRNVENDQPNLASDLGSFNDSLVNPVARPYIHFSNGASQVHPIAKLTDKFRKLQAPSISIQIVNPRNKEPHALITVNMVAEETRSS